MVSSFAATGFACLCFAYAAALRLFPFLNSQCDGAGRGCTTWGEAPLLDIAAAKVWPPLAAVVVHFVAVALTFHHLMVIGRRVVAPVVGAGAGNGRRLISGLVIFMLCVSAGALQFILFGQAAGGGGGARLGAQQARALGLAALHALPAAATVTFFCGMVLIFGGVVGGGAAVAGDGPVQGALRLLTKIAAGAAAALVGLMALATLTLHGP